MKEFIVQKKNSEEGSLWLVKILGLWFWGVKRERAFRFKCRKEAFKIGKKELLRKELKKNIEVIAV